jgi:RecJ-like exonuclease
VVEESKMTKRVKVETGYVVPDRYVTLEDGEELCPECDGTGKVIVCYTHNDHVKGTCPKCGGMGKTFRCSKCGQLRAGGRMSHPGKDWMDGLCLDCILIDERLGQGQ